MPNPNAIVSTTIRLEGEAPSAGKQGRGETAVELEGGRRVRLDPENPRSPGFAQVLEGLRQQRLPVYVEVDPETDAVVRLLVPNVGRVVGITPVEGGLGIELDTSHAVHVVRADADDARELEAVLRRALGQREPVVLTFDDDRNVLDVRGFTPHPEGGLPPFPPFPRPEPPWFERWWAWRLWRYLWWWLWWPIWWWRCPSATRAQQVFDAMAARTCDPQAVPPPCIPFMYPDDGCWARAHEMCRLMIDMGLSPGKVWIDQAPGDSLTVATRNHPSCSVTWGWHVAPTLCVRAGLFRTRRMVIDPALFTTPVTVDTWKGVQSSPAATLTHTGPEQYWHGGGDDPGYTSTNQTLAQYRLALQTRSNQSGPPPYAHCP